MLRPHDVGEGPSGRQCIDVAHVRVLALVGARAPRVPDRRAPANTATRCVTLDESSGAGALALYDHQEELSDHVM